MNLDQELDRLYGRPLSEFTSARNELARELRDGGEREAADEVKGLAKPSIPAWTVNQLVRAERLQVRSLLTASEQVRDAQAKLVSGGSPDELREAVSRQREVVGALLESAEGVLESAGQTATETTLERIRKTLTAVAGDEEGRRLVESGRLTEDLEPAGFGPLAPGAAPSGKRSRTPARATGRAERERGKRVDAAEGKLQALEAEAAELKERVKSAKGEARRAASAAQAARRTAQDEKRRLERLNARLKAAKDALERTRSS